MTSATANSILGVTDLFCTWQRSDNTMQAILLPKPNDIIFNPNAKTINITERSKLGVLVLAGRVLDETLPEFELTWGVRTLTLLAMQHGYAFGTPAETPVTGTITTIMVTKGSYEASIAGYEGFGVAVDAVSTGSYENPNSPGVIVSLIQQPFATFNSSTAGSFAVGANFALKFSADLVGTITTAKQVTINVPNLVGSGISLMDEAFTNFAFTYNQILVDRSIIQTTYPSVSLKRDGGTIDAKQDTKLIYSVLDSSGGCSVPLITYLGKAQSRKC
jgi:hypothetical protein